METMEKTMNKSNFTMTTNNFEKEINDFIEGIKRYTDFMDYQISGDINPDELKNLKNSIPDLSLNQKKKLRNLLVKANYKMSLRTINHFLHFLYKNVLRIDTRVRIKPSVKEEEIQMRRKEWVEARKKSEMSLFIYKSTKGDFYKNKEQKIKIAKSF